jgi:hypothetical protein
MTNTEITFDNGYGRRVEVTRRSSDYDAFVEITDIRSGRNIPARIPANKVADIIRVLSGPSETAPATPTPARPKVGDRVRVLRSPYVTVKAGDVGVVTDTSRHPSRSRVKADGNSYSLSFEDSALEILPAAPAPSPFKVGDIVRLARKSRAMSAQLGATAVVERELYVGAFGDDRIGVRWLTGRGSQMNGGYDVADFDKVEPAERFPVGQRVRFLKDNARFAPTKVGGLGTVTESPDEDGLLRASIDTYTSDYGWYFTPGDVEPCTEPANPWAIGARVRVVTDDIPDIWRGERGQIAARCGVGSCDDHRFVRIFGREGRRFLDTKDLVLDPAPSPAPLPIDF